MNRLFHDQLAARASASGLIIPSGVASRLEAYYDLLAHWNWTINLTSLALEPATDAAIDRLLIEPLVLARRLAPGVPVWFDLGSGGGSPAVPLRLVKPEGRLVMVEARERKAAFLREVIRVLNLPDTFVEVQRIESVAASHLWAASADLITLRAVRVDEQLLAAIRAMLRVGGQVAFLGTSAQFEVPADFSEEWMSDDGPRRFLVLRRGHREC